ncbi:MULTISPECIES: DUF5979 domain-containing protein [unclassified Agrococcus]|uniref:DUF5979 domain-containing protein n=1 Tax=unclassified Agrococcus TaxID=2615065 RepID=UPI0036098BC7
MQGWRTRVGAIITAAAVAFVTLIAAPAAVAAPPYTSTASVDSLTFTQSTIASQAGAELTGTWSLPDNAPSPAGFSVDLPPALLGFTDSFPLLDPQGIAMGQCTVTGTQIYCDIDPAYLTANPLNVSGTFFFDVYVNTTVTQNTQVTYDFGQGLTTTVTVTPPVNPCPDCVFTGIGTSKYGEYFAATDAIDWYVVVKAPATGMVGGETVTVVDRLGPNQAPVLESGAPRVRLQGTNQVDATGPINFQFLPAQAGLQVSVDANGDTVATFESQPGWFYKVVFSVDTTDDGGSTDYTNEADVAIEGQASQTVATSVARQGGGGTGEGENVGRFRISKDVIWSGGTPVPGLTFTGTYTATTPSGVVTQGTFSVVEDGTWTSADLPTGSIVTITETTPTSPSNVTWSAPIYSQNTFAIVGATTTNVTLTNQATLQTGTFTASKVVTGSGASLVPGDTAFTLSYSYPAGTGFAAGSGSLTLLANGTVATSTALPLGAVLTLSEATPAAIGNASWGTPVISPSTVTIGSGTPVAVTVTNTITLATGTFTASKVVTGTGAALVPGDATFTLEYSYPAGSGFAAGSGSLTLLADGTVATSTALPIGAVLTLSEATPAAVANASWGTPVISPSTVTIGSGTPVAVTVTNTITLATGTFSASKVVTGSGAELVPDDATFTLTYSYPAGTGFPAGSGSLTLPADGTVVTSPALPVGAVVTLVEETPAPVEDAGWSAPVLSTSTLTIGTGESATVTVTNELTLGTGTFSASKVVTGSGAALVADDATFTLDYAYPAGTGFAAGSGSLTLSADGTVATSPALPIGAVVTLTEAAPAAVQGATWQSARLSTSTVVIGSEEALEVVVVTNTITTNPTPTAPAPTDEASSGSGVRGPASSGSGALPRTGAELLVGALAVAAALILAGALVARRRSTTA